MTENAKRGMSIFLFVFSVLAFVGGIFTCIIHSVNVREKKSGCDEVEARVAEILQTKDREDGKIWETAVFEYSYNGKTYRIEDSARTSSDFGTQYSVGDVVTVWVDRQDPSKILLPNSVLMVYSLGGFFAVFGAVLFLLKAFAVRIDKNSSSLLLRAMGIYLPAMLSMSYALWFVGSHFGNGGRENLFSNIPFLVALTIVVFISGVLVYDFIAHLIKKFGKRKNNIKSEESTNKTEGGD